MIRLMCGGTLQTRVPSKDLLHNSGLVDIRRVFERNRLRVFGLFTRRSINEPLGKIRCLEAPAWRPPGRRKKTWEDCGGKSERSWSWGRKRSGARELAFHHQSSNLVKWQADVKELSKCIAALHRTPCTFCSRYLSFRSCIRFDACTQLSSPSAYIKRVNNIWDKTNSKQLHKTYMQLNNEKIL